MDGTLFDTEGVKLASFRDAFAPLCANEEQLGQVDAYNTAHRGIPRAEKFQHILTDILGQPPRLQDEVDARYAHLLEQRLGQCPPIAGLAEFIAAVAAVRYVVSSAPEAEIHRMLTGHGLDAAFHGVFGRRWTKTQALGEICARHRDEHVVFFGDAPADRDAARQAGVAFIAVNPNAALKAQVQDSIADYTYLDQDTLAALLASAA
ncbi:HAD family phosphatase [Actinospica durhamensis]|uniref:HAD family phosphatase n=2 Tax=Actinospica durhamensis TaxID=1508375 RepID=A0A941IR25_9ACTN|nr:HAD hydrolase-like protein [Actinospica durhamensis]MBR7831866.1 HAD family phosphatase [Actinospica durhamensis]